jgi:hypothetical protein
MKKGRAGLAFPFKIEPCDDSRASVLDQKTILNE